MTFTKRTHRMEEGAWEAPIMKSTGARNMNSNKKDLSPGQRQELLRVLKARFEKNMNRHKGLEWAQVQEKLKVNAERVWSLNEMERTGGEPDVIGHDKKTGEYIFGDCSAESPKDRRSLDIALPLKAQCP